MSNVRIIPPEPEHIGEGPTTERETPDTPVSDVSLPPSSLGPPLCVPNGVTDRSLATRASRSRPGNPGRGPGPNTDLFGSGPFSGNRGHLVWRILWLYVLVLAASFTLGRVAGMDLIQAGLFMVIGFCGAVGWVRDRNGG